VVFAVAVGIALTASYQLGQSPAVLAEEAYFECSVEAGMLEGIEVANFAVELDRLVPEDLEM
jgi:hypothetical protein